jgi:hypothetical protein
MINVSRLNPMKRCTLSSSQIALLTLLCAVLLIILSWTLAVWMATDDVPISEEHWIALGLGLVFSLPIGSGLIALMFYSNRSGHDEAATPKVRRDDT